MSEFGLGSPLAGSASNKRIPVVLCLDTSTSMNEEAKKEADPKPASGDGRRIDQLNTALKSWKTELRQSAQLRRQADICLITFDSAATVVDAGGGTDPGFVQIADFNPPSLLANGVTRLDLAVRLAIAKTAEHRSVRRVETHRAKIWIISDGVPTDGDGHHNDNAWRSILPEIRAGEARQDFAVYAAGVYGAKMDVLTEIAGRGAFDLRGLSLARILKVVTDSLGKSGATVESEKDAVADTVDKMQRIFSMLGK